MKIKALIGLMMTFGFLLFFSCQQEETTAPEPTNQITEDVFAKNWQEADLTTLFSESEMNYPISQQQLQNLIQKKGVTQIQFVPGVINDELYVKVVAVNHTNGEVLGEELIKQNKNLKISEKLKRLQNESFNVESIIDTNIKKHILPFSEAANYLTSWEQKSTKDINELTSYKGERIRYFSIGVEFMKYMNNLGSESINLSWGLNNDNKLTTVLTPVTGGNVKSATKNSGTGPIGDFTDPCPNTCD